MCFRRKGAGDATNEGEEGSVRARTTGKTTTTTTNTTTAAAAAADTDAGQEATTSPKAKAREYEHTLIANSHLLLLFVGAMLHHTESWSPKTRGSQLLEWVSVACVVLPLATRFHLAAVFLAVSVNLGMLFSKWPGLANHSNVLVLLLLVHLGNAFWEARWGRSGSRGRWLESSNPLCIGALGLVYFFAGVHKLNTGFLDPATSCTRTFLERPIRRYGLPMTWGDYVMDSLVVMVSCVVIVVELCSGVLLFRRRWSWAAVPLALSLHFYLSPIGFYDFSGIATSILFLVLAEDLRAGGQLREFRLFSRGFRVDRRAVHYALANVAAALVAYLCCHCTTKLCKNRVEAARGHTLNIATLWLFRPRWEAFLRGGGAAWRGVRAWPAKWSHALVHLLIVFFAMNPYLGLRTAGCFTMYSNLRTELNASNHLFIPNAIRLFSFQEDVVSIINVPRSKHVRVKKGAPDLPRVLLEGVPGGAVNVPRKKKGIPAVFRSAFNRTLDLYRITARGEYKWISAMKRSWELRGVSPREGREFVLAELGAMQRDNMSRPAVVSHTVKIASNRPYGLYTFTPLSEPAAAEPLWPPHHFLHQKIPRMTFDRILELLRRRFAKAGPVPMTVEVDGTVIKSKDILQEPVFQRRKYPLLTGLLYFRSGYFDNPRSECVW